MSPPPTALAAKLDGLPARSNSADSTIPPSGKLPSELLHHGSLMIYLFIFAVQLQELAYSTPPPDSYDDPIKNALTEIASLATNTNELVPGAESKENLVK